MSDLGSGFYKNCFFAQWRYEWGSTGFDFYHASAL